MTDLIKKLESAKEGSRELDAEIYIASGKVLPGFKPLGPLHPGIFGDGGYPTITAPHYTTSIDAALSLVPEGFPCSLLVYSNGEAAAGVAPAKDGYPKLLPDDISTPALALTIAALKARGE